ncbi:hypothetical protein WG904_16400 [Pedobacter sp. Du54]|uniref:DUF6843 domain-containing protein n=1 Tax=Pedobacter anseongensis TaxID=3133439 RepID=UPI0030A89822
MKTLGLLLVAFILLGCDKGEKEIVVVPRNYTGLILIIYDQPNGADPVFQDGKRVYEIPSNGILKTKFSPNPGWIGLTEFYYESISPENKILFKLDPRIIPADTVVASGGTAGSIKKEAGGKEYIRFLEYYVGNKDQISVAREQVPKLDIIKLAQ